FGVFTHCSRFSKAPDKQMCTIYRTLENIPAVSWKVHAVLLFGGWMLLAFGTGLCQRRVSGVIGTILGLLIFPCSLDSAFANEIGGSSSTYNAGKYKLGWDYMVAILDAKSKIFFSTATESIILVREDEQ
uniref:Uncharacterized protein n=1 Tax=Chrysemys picta bellii TaxID=8478 RepID=A0A8C3I9S2_CHRPI